MLAAQQQKTYYANDFLSVHRISPLHLLSIKNTGEQPVLGLFRLLTLGPVAEKRVRKVSLNWDILEHP